MSEIRLGVSACLVGERVRYDGGHKQNAFLLDELASHVRLVPVCPEVGIGLGVPREPIRLERRDGDRSGWSAQSGTRSHAGHERPGRPRRSHELRGRDLSGFVLKKGSPSCGLERVREWSGDSAPPSGRGLFAQALVDAWPQLPLEEEGRLNDPGLREHFVDRVFGHARVRDFFATDWPAAGLVRFHSSEKAAVLAHDPQAATGLGRLVARQGELGREELEQRYRDLHARAFAQRATPGRQANALMHLAGHVKDDLGASDRAELCEVIEDYRGGLVPVAVPLALLGRHLREAGDDWARAQAYLRPYPKQLGLRGVIDRGASSR